MERQGYARLMAAMMAAISLHALLFSLLPSRQKLTMPSPSGGLEVELLAAQQHAATPSVSLTTAVVTASSPVVVKQSITPTSKLESIKLEPANKAVAPQPQPVRHSIAMLTVSSSSHEATKHRPKTEPRSQTKPVTAVSVPVQVAQRVQSISDSSDIATNAGRAETPHVPQAVQQRILTHVHYPRQARRHGWQGRAEFELNIQQQSIHAVTLLASTGFPILDRAAERGLAAVDRIPLSNGLYRMPIVFHLQ